MENSELLKRQKILEHICALPQKVLALHGMPNTSEFLLYDLCKPECFNLKKAAYLIDNPDFDCFKGIAGFSVDQMFSQDVIWETPELFTEHMWQASFNKKVREIMYPSVNKLHKVPEESIRKVSDYLSMNQPTYCSWPLKHDNHGILIYEAADTDETPHDMIKTSACLLGFCPVY
jgi:hypothetical protein